VFIALTAAPAQLFACIPADFLSLDISGPASVLDLSQHARPFIHYSSFPDVSVILPPHSQIQV